MKGKILITGVLLSSLLVGSVSATSSGYNVSIDGRSITLNASPVVQNGVTYVPFKTIFNELGIASAWDSTSKKVVAINTKNGDLIYIKANSKVVYVNGKTIRMNAPAKSIGGSVYVPIREIDRVIGAVVDVKGKNIIIDTPAPDVKPGNPPVVDNSASGNNKPTESIAASYPKFELEYQLPSNHFQSWKRDLQVVPSPEGAINEFDKYAFMDNRDFALTEKFYEIQYFGNMYEVNLSSHKYGPDQYILTIGLKNPDDIDKLLKYAYAKPAAVLEFIKPVADYVNQEMAESKFTIAIDTEVKYELDPANKGVRPGDVIKYDNENGLSYVVATPLFYTQLDYKAGTSTSWYSNMPNNQEPIVIHTVNTLKNDR